MSDLPWSDLTVEEWAEHLLSIGTLPDVIELEIRAREIARDPDSPRARRYLETLLDESCSSDLELQGFFALRNDERSRRLESGGGAR